MTTIKDIYDRVTHQIIAELENGVRPWVKPWNAEHATARVTRPLRHNGIPYNGINILMLWTEALAQGFTAPYWLTYRQAQELGAQVRKGEKGSPVIYADKFVTTELDKNGNDTEQVIPYRLFSPKPPKRCSRMKALS